MTFFGQDPRGIRGIYGLDFSRGRGGGGDFVSVFRSTKEAVMVDSIAVDSPVDVGLMKSFANLGQQNFRM